MTLNHEMRYIVWLGSKLHWNISSWNRRQSDTKSFLSTFV